MITEQTASASGRAGHRGRISPAILWPLLATLLVAAAPPVYYEDALPTTLNPLFSRTMVDVRAQALVFEPLFFQAPVISGMGTRLVERYERLDGGLSLKLTLKRGNRWHDGEPLRAADVCFTIAAILDPATPTTLPADYRKSLAGCVAEDDTVAIVTFRKIYEEPRRHLGFFVLPAHAFTSTAVRPEDPFAVAPIGAGAMRARRTPDGVTFERVVSPIHDAHIEILELRAAAPAAQVAAVLSGAAAGMVSVPPGLRGQIAASDRVHLKSYGLHAWWFVAVDTHRAALADKRVRQALDLSIDRDALRDRMLGPMTDDYDPTFEPVTGPFVGQSAYYNRSVKPTRPDRAAARRRLLEAGATESRGRWTWQGKPITLAIGMNAALEVEAPGLLPAVQEQLAAAGFAATIARIPPDVWDERTVAGTLTGYDLLIGKWSFELVEDVNDLFQTRTGATGARNLLGYSNAEVDALLSRYDAATTETAARDAYYELHALLADELPYLFLFELGTKSAWSDRVGHDTVQPYHYFSMFDEWTIEDGPN